VIAPDVAASAPPAALSSALAFGNCARTSSGRAQSTHAAPSTRQHIALPRPRPDASAPAQAEGDEATVHDVELPENFRELARQPGEPQIPGVTMVHLHPLGLPPAVVT